MKYKRIKPTNDDVSGIIVDFLGGNDLLMEIDWVRKGYLNAHSCYSSYSHSAYGLEELGLHVMIRKGRVFLIKI